MTFLAESNYSDYKGGMQLLIKDNYTSNTDMTNFMKNHAIIQEVIELLKKNKKNLQTLF